MRYRRRPGGGFPFILIFVILFMPDLIGLVFTLLPLAITGFVVYNIVKALTSSPRRTRQSYTRNNTSKRNEKGMSNFDYSRIDKKLSNYFKENVSLPVIDEVSLVTTGGSYTNIDSLFITYKDEKVMKMSELKDSQYVVYEKILSLLVEFSKQPDEVLKTKVEIKPEEVKKSAKKLSDGEKYIELINELNEAIPQEEITNGLYQTCDLLKQIELSEVKDSKYDEEKIQKLYDYYLPILTGILENYKKLQDSAVKGEEFKNCEAQLIKTIILINQALKTIYSDLHADDYLDINADISTLQTLLEKDGYTNNPFEAKK